MNDLMTGDSCTKRRSNVDSCYIEEHDDDKEEEAKLRQLLADKPRHARAMAQLAVLLFEHQQQRCVKREDQHQRSHTATGSSNHEKHETFVQDVKSRDDEAWYLAQTAIQLKPEKPFGYWALSVISETHQERMKALQQAADRAHGVPKVLARCRLLLEPRQDETIRLRGIMGNASWQHPSRRSLNPAEETLYQELEPLLCNCYDTAPTISEQQRIQMALRDYSLGLMFRKMIPLQTHQPRAIHHLHRAHQHLPDSHPHRPLIAFWLATLVGTGSCTTTDCAASSSVGVVTRCPPEYVTGLYSTFAERFDDLLVSKLDYQTPTVLRRLLDTTNFHKSDRHWFKGLDLGCGTGLSGVAFRHCVQEMVGIDLSPEMIDKAHQRQCYHELIVGDVTNVSKLHQNSNTFDLVVACDVFVYIGDLSDVFLQVSHMLKDGGCFAFSTELLDVLSDITSNRSPSYQLLPSGRFAHTVRYVEMLALQNNFHIRASKVCPIRKNERKDITGCLTILEKHLTIA